MFIYVAIYIYVKVKHEVRLIYLTLIHQFINATRLLPLYISNYPKHNKPDIHIAIYLHNCLTLVHI